MDNWKEVKEAISACKDEEELRSLRNLADQCLQQVKNDNAAALHDSVVEKYKGKYILSHGKFYTKMKSFTNPHNTQVIYVEDIVESCSQYFVAKGRCLEIDYTTETYDFRQNDINADNTGVVKVSNQYDDHLNISYSDIDAIVSKDDIKTLLDTAFSNLATITSDWKQ